MKLCQTSERATRDSAERGEVDPGLLAFEGDLDGSRLREIDPSGHEELRSVEIELQTGERDRVPLHSDLTLRVEVAEIFQLLPRHFSCE